MNQSVSKGTISAIVAVVVLVLGLVAWKVFGPGGKGVSEAERQAEMRMNQGEATAIRQGQPGGTAGGAPGGSGPPGAGTGLPPGSQ